MTQEERYNKTLQELANFKRIVESNTYQEEKEAIVNELNSIKEQINATKNSYKIDLVELQSNRNNLLRIEKELNKANSSEGTDIDINELNEEKEKINNWFNEQDSLKNNTNNNLLDLLNKQEEKQKQLIQIESLINKFNKNNSQTEETLDTNKTLEALTNIESLYNTEDFNEEEYTKLKEQFINEQNLIDSILEQAEINLNTSKAKYDEITNNYESIKDNLNNNELRNLKNEIKNYERDYNIWQETIENIKKLKIDHQFVDEDIVKESIDNALDSIELESVQEDAVVIDPVKNEDGEQTENTAPANDIEEPDKSTEIVSLTDMYNNEEVDEPTEENEITTDESEQVENPNKDKTDEKDKLSFKRVEKARSMQLSSNEFNNLLKTAGLIINGDVKIEGDINITINNYLDNTIEEDEPLEETKEETTNEVNLESLKVDITNNKEAREKISNTNKNVSNIKKAIKANLIQPEEGLNEIDDLTQKEHQEINNIINNYYDIKDHIESIINDSNKCIELTKIGLGKENEQKELSEYDIKTINKISSEDYSNIIIKLVNIMQYEKTINEINKLIDKDNNNKTK